MAREISTDLVKEALADSNRPILIADIETSDGNVRVWTGIGNLSFNGQTFYGIAGLGGISAIKESGSEVRANAVSMLLTGIPSADIAKALSTNYRGRPGTIWLGFLSDDGDLIDSIILFKGTMDAVNLAEGPETSSIIAAAESRLADLDRPRLRRYTDEDQKALFPGDDGLEYVEGIQNEELVWGG